MTELFAPVGVYDSGLGGISVLRRLRRILPSENFYFFGDNAAAPYGTRPPEEVLALARAALDRTKRVPCKALVIACNTATAVAADTLRRENPDFVIAAIEPALKPAVERHPGGRILLMATPLTLKMERVANLSHRFENAAAIEAVACPGLVELIENGHLDDDELAAYLARSFSKLDAAPDAVVLGCTHYPHILPALRRFFGEKTAFYDGGEGCARHVKELLVRHSLVNPAGTGEVSFDFSAPSEKTLALARTLLDR